MKTYDPDAVPVKAGRIPSQDVDGEIFAITPDDGFLHNFNEVGSLIWNLIDGKHSLGEIESSILAEYDAEPHQLRNDLTTFFKVLGEKGLVEYAR
ncbi:MAG: PqqD family protein [bacterium]|nr:PqqD family protein [bacterium]